MSDLRRSCMTASTRVCGNAAYGVGLQPEAWHCVDGGVLMVIGAGAVQSGLHGGAEATKALHSMGVGGPKGWKWSPTFCWGRRAGWYRRALSTSISELARVTLVGWVA